MFDIPEEQKEKHTETNGKFAFTFIHSVVFYRVGDSKTILHCKGVWQNIHADQEGE